MFFPSCSSLLTQHDSAARQSLRLLIWVNLYRPSCCFFDLHLYRQPPFQIGLADKQAKVPLFLLWTRHGCYFNVLLSKFLLVCSLVSSFVLFDLRVVNSWPCASHPSLSRFCVLRLCEVVQTEGRRLFKVTAFAGGRRTRRRPWRSDRSSCLMVGMKRKKNCQEEWKNELQSDGGRVRSREK